ncbi:hypothetical protein [Ruegeria sediminis]|nr:hypothetical protein [Ruegeria sediminis]
MLSTLQHSYRGLSLLMTLNWDRFLSVAAIAIALTAGAYVLTL